jgi:glycosyltransferase involved in cell wall biosynthesis
VPHADISVIIPAYDAAAYLAEAIDSVLKQTLLPQEIIVVDDGSTDTTAGIAASFPEVTLVRARHGGAGAARNRGVEHARAGYLAFLDADDYWLPEKLQQQLSMLDQHSELDGVFSRFELFHSPDMTEADRLRYPIRENAVAGNMAGCLLIKHEAFHDVGGFDETLPGGEFIEWMLRARQAGRMFGMVEATLMRRRIHGRNSVLREQASMHAAYLRIVREKRKRDAAAGGAPS